MNAPCVRACVRAGQTDGPVGRQAGVRGHRPCVGPQLGDSGAGGIGEPAPCSERPRALAPRELVGDAGRATCGACQDVSHERKATAWMGYPHRQASLEACGRFRHFF